MQSSISVKGANCPSCFNETLENLSQLEGVQSVHGSFSGPCIEIDYDDGALESITATISAGLHGTEIYSGETQMINLEPVTLSTSCTHNKESEIKMNSTTSTNSNTNTIVPSMILGEIVTQNPSLAIEFEKRCLDYCCQGARTLQDAATSKGLDAQKLADELTDAMIDEEPADWASLSPVELMDNIESVHHKYLWDNFDRTGALVQKIADVHGERHPELLEVESLYEAIRADLEPHLKAEEEMLFPKVREIANSESTEAATEEFVARVKEIADEHKNVGDMLAKLNLITNGYSTPADGCATYAACYQALADLESDIHLHIHKESNVLFPALGTEPVNMWSKSAVS